MCTRIWVFSTLFISWSYSRNDDINSEARNSDVKFQRPSRIKFPLKKLPKCSHVSSHITFHVSIHSSFSSLSFPPVSYYLINWKRYQPHLLASLNIARLSRDIGLIIISNFHLICFTQPNIEWILAMFTSSGVQFCLCFETKRLEISRQARTLKWLPFGGIRERRV